MQYDVQVEHDAYTLCIPQASDEETLLCTDSGAPVRDSTVVEESKRRSQVIDQSEVDGPGFQRTLQSSTSTASTSSVMENLVSIDDAFQRVVISTGKRMVSEFYGFSAIIPKKWAITAKSENGFLRYEMANPEKGAVAGVVSILVSEKEIPGYMFIKEIAEQERQSLKTAVPNFLEEKFFKTSIGDQEAYLLQGTFTLGTVSIRVAQYYLLKNGRYVAVGLTAQTTKWSKEVEGIFLEVVRSLEISGIKK
jgi:hypothetical protein